MKRPQAGFIMYYTYTIIALVIFYITAKCLLISKFIYVFKLCCIPKESCVQYFNNCFNNNVTNTEYPTPTHCKVIFTRVPTDSNESFQRIERKENQNNET